MSDALQDFERQVIGRSRQTPVLVDFWAPWCGPCRTLGPVLERLAAQANGRWELVKVNTEQHPDLAAVFNIASIPAVKLFVDGTVVDEFMGALPEKEIRRFLDRALPSPLAGQMAEAKRLLSEGAAEAARAVLEPIAAAEPGNAEARLLLAQALFTAAPERVPALLESIPPEHDLGEPARAWLTLARLARLTEASDTLPPSRVRDRYLEGARALRSRDFGAALEAFIEVLGRDRKYDDAGAKEACKAIFQVLGRRHELAERHFRAFSSALHA